MIIVRLTTGLGNQMFQYAAGLAAAEATCSILKLETDWFHHRTQKALHNRYGLHCFNIIEQFATKDEICRLQGIPVNLADRIVVPLARLMRLGSFSSRFAQTTREHHQPCFGFYDDFGAIEPHTRLLGYFQSERFFENIKPTIRNHFSFRYPLSLQAKAVADMIGRATSATAVHFRRGDYATSSLGVLPLSYYMEAMAHIQRVDPGSIFFVFSDDIVTVKRELQPSSRIVFVDQLEGQPDHETMRLMSMCQNNIIANSSFSWWAAWLNARPDKHVVAPRPWFAASDRDTSDVVPGSWVRLDVSYEVSP